MFSESCDKLRGKEVMEVRMRKRHNLAPRMERCAEYLIDNPAENRGHWKNGDRPLLLEIGCGKGSFTCALARQRPDSEIIAMEKVPDVMILAMERAKMMGLTNVRFLDYDAAGLRDVFDRGEVDRIFLNFSDPWPKSRDAKFRLTAPAFLRSYADVLPTGGEVRLKTDNRPLFEWSLKQFHEENWELRKLTFDLHAEGQRGILTDYEMRFLQNGIPICGLIAVRTEHTLNSSAGMPPRLRDAALSDARGAKAESEGKEQNL